MSFYRYWRAPGADHFYTTNVNEIGVVVPGIVGRYGYKGEGIQCLLYDKQIAGSVPLYRYFLGSRVDHFYTTNSAEIGTTTSGQRGKYGFVSEGIAGYCFPSARPGTIPLYRYYHPAGVDHFYTTNAKEIGTTEAGKVGRYGYKSEGIACHVLPYYG